MNHPETPRYVEVKDGDRIVAAAEVTMLAAGTARTSLHAAAGHIAPGWRSNLVDAVMDLPEVQASARLEATVPLGDVEFLERLRERTIDAITRPVGSTLLLDASIPPSRLLRLTPRPRPRAGRPAPSRPPGPPSPEAR